MRPQPRHRSPLATSVGLVLLGLVGGLVLAEAALQIGSLFVGPRGNAAAWREDGHRLRLLFLGDSNTYGIAVEPSEAYPRVLEAEWRPPPGEAGLEVVNLGFPGTNSTKVRNDLPRILRVLRPDVLLVMIGANDYWTLPETAGGSFGDRLADWAWRHSRVYRFLYMALRSRANAELSVDVTQTLPYFAGQKGVGRVGADEFPLGFTMDPSPPAGDVRDEALRQNLREIIATARDAAVPLVLLTYASSGQLYGRANAIAREEARSADVALVDVAAVFAPLCPDGRCTQLLGDGHPSADGHALIARTLRDALPRVLQPPADAKR